VPALPRGRGETGVLERVNVFGIVGAFADLDTGEEPVRAFYPWSAVLTIASVEETQEALGL
jgi:hypothetical protein